MNNFFEKYKKLREDQKIDLTDIENRTKINIKYLTALETGNFDLIQKPYTRLFLRAYINEIGADPDKAISELTEYFLKEDGSESKETEKTEQGEIISDEKKKDISTQSDKKLNKFQDISLGPEKMKKQVDNIHSQLLFNTNPVFIDSDIALVHRSLLF